MEIKEFLELCVGNWFSQRASYQLVEQKAENSKSEISIESLTVDHPDVVKLCQQHHINPGSTLGGTKTHWDNSADWGKPKQVGSTLLILIPDPNDPAVGKLIKASGMGQYTLGKDEALTLTLQENDHLIEERLWFVSPNLRLRTSIIKHSDAISQTVFYSEIRRFPAAAPAK